MNKSKSEPQIELSKSVIFDLFYQKQTVSRSGGGTQHKKMGRVTSSSEDMNVIEKALTQDPKYHKLLSYYTKLKNRKVNIAPPPRPNN